MKLYKVQRSPFGALYSVIWIDSKGRKHVVRSFAKLETARAHCRDLNDLSWRASRLGPDAPVQVTL